MFYFHYFIRVLFWFIIKSNVRLASFYNYICLLKYFKTAKRRSWLEILMKLMKKYLINKHRFASSIHYKSIITKYLSETLITKHSSSISYTWNQKLICLPYFKLFHLYVNVKLYNTLFEKSSKYSFSFHSIIYVFNLTN